MSTDDGFPTATSQEQRDVEMEVLRMYGRILNSPNFEPESSIAINREAHIEFLSRGLLEPLKASYVSLEASRPWIAFWILHGLDLMGQRDTIIHEFAEKVTSVMSSCQHPTGGFGGGPFQIPHLATTYAAVSALVCIGTEEALSIIDRPKLKRFILSMKDESTGGFRMHEGGETDVRGTYCAIAVSSLLQFLDEALIEGVGEYVKSCQSYEGGIAGEPGMEAHGGYSYCALAALAILGEAEKYIDLDAFTDWLCRRQMSFEGGFNGRANKLVDSCYTFWQGACFPILADIHRINSVDATAEAPVMFAVEPAQMYVLLACQSDNGGLRDKPGKPADFYHSCYALSGLAALQYPTNDLRGFRVLGNKIINRLERNCVLYNNVIDRVLFARKHFSRQPQDGTEGKGALKSYALAHHISSSY